MEIKKQIRQLIRLLKNNIWMLVCIIIILFIKIKNCEIPVIGIIAQNSALSIIFIKPIKGSIYAEILDFCDILGMSVLASLVFLFFSVYIPNYKKNKLKLKEVEWRIKEILNNMEAIITRCVEFYKKLDGYPQNKFENFTDDEIEWIINKVKFDKKICSYNNTYIMGYEFMQKKAVEIKKDIKKIFFDYIECINGNEYKVLYELSNCSYIQKFAEIYKNYLASGQGDIPKETFEEMKRINPKILAMIQTVISNCTIEVNDIKNGIEMYKNLKKEFEWIL